MSRFVFRLLSVTCIALAAGTLCQARSLFVSLDGDNTTGADWDTAYTSINYAVELMLDEPEEAGDIIYMKEGYYPIWGTVVITNHPFLNILGGYEGEGLPGEVGTNRSVILRFPGLDSGVYFRNVLVTNSTVNWQQVSISGGRVQASGLGLYILNSTSSFENCVIANSRVWYNSTIYGLGAYVVGGKLHMNNCFVTNNYRENNWWHEYGYGTLAAVDADVVISNTVFHSNRHRPRGAPQLFGGAIYLVRGSAIIDNCTISSNRFIPEHPQDSALFRGAGLFATNVNPLIIKDCTFINNGMQVGTYFQNWHGNAMWLSGNDLDATISRVKIISCSAYYDLNSYAIYMPSGKVAFSDITMISNNGCGIFIGNDVAEFSIDHGFITGCSTNAINIADNAWNAKLKFNHMTIVDNQGWGIYSQSAAPTTMNSIVWGNVPGQLRGPGVITYSCIEGGYAGVGNIHANPLFGNPIANDYHLQSRMGRWALTNWVVDEVDSPCIDRAATNAPFSNEPLPNGGRANLGYYGNTPESSKTFTYPGIRLTAITNEVMRGKRAAPQTFIIGATNGYSRKVVLNATPGTSWLMAAPPTRWTTGDIYNAVFATTYATEHLPPGTNIGFVIIDAWDEWTSLFCSNSPANVIVNMRVMEIGRSATNLSFYSLTGHSPPDAPFQVFNAGAGPMQYSIASDVPWMSFWPDTGVSHSAADPQTHYINFDAGWLGAGGTCVGQVLINATNGGGAESVIQVEMLVGDSPEIGISKSLLTNDVTLGYGGTNGFAVRRVAGEVPLEWNCEVIDGADWLSVSPASGVSTGEWNNVEVTYSPGLAMGVNKGKILVSGIAAGYGNPAIASPQTVEVWAYGVEKPLLMVSPTVITNRVLQGFDASTQMLSVINVTGGGRLSYRVSDDASWLIPTPDTGVVERGMGQALVSLHYNTEGLEPGQHFARMIVSAEDVEHGGAVQGSPAVVQVTLDVAPLAVLGLDCQALEQHARKGGVPPTQMFRVRNASREPRGAMAFRASIERAWADNAAAQAPPSWLSIYPDAGISDGDWVDVRVEYDIAGLAPGLYKARVRVRAEDREAGREAMDSPTDLPVSMRVLRPTPGDMTGDTRGDFTLYNEEEGFWYVCTITGEMLAWGAVLGGPGYKPLLGDFDGDGRTDLCVFREVSAGWYARPVDALHMLLTAHFGAPGFTPVVGDFDGDGRSDFGVYDRITGLWYIRRTDGSLLAWASPWGGYGMQPVMGDFDGDSCHDLAVYGTESGLWHIRSLAGDLIDWNIPWGGNGLIPLAGDMDADGRDDLVVYHPESANWFVLSLTKGVIAWAINWGGHGFTPVLGDYDGDGAMDIGVYHEATGTWYARTLEGRLLLWGFPWGGAGLLPP